MRPYVYEVYEQARALANDNDVIVGGRTFHNQMLRPFFQQAYREYFRTAGKWSAPIAEARAFFNLPAYSTVVEPVSYGINNFNAPIRVEVRTAQTEVTGVSFTLGTPVSVSKVAHGLANGAQIIASGFAASSEVVDLNNAWTVTVVDPDTFTLNGSRFPNSDSVVTGTYTSGDGAFQELPLVAHISDIEGTASSYVRHYAFTRGRLLFPPSTEAVQLRVTYQANGDAPVLLHQEVPVDDSLDFFAYRTIGLAKLTQGDPDADRFNSEAQQQLEDLLHAQVKATHAIARRRQPFRPRRNGPFVW